MLASKRVGGRGGSNFDGQIDGQIVRFPQNGLPEKQGNVKALSAFCFERSFQDPVSKIASDFFRPDHRSAF